MTGCETPLLPEANARSLASTGVALRVQAEARAGPLSTSLTRVRFESQVTVLVIV